VLARKTLGGDSPPGHLGTVVNWGLSL